MADAPHHDQLPLPDYDHLPVGSLEGRIRSLDGAGLEALLAYERDHANRVQVVQLLENRLEAVQGGAPLSGGSPMANAPEADAAPQTDSQGGASVNEGPAMNPPSQGVPTNPAQPR
ncbi:hypothetical protein [Nocardioides deserti]|uniref:DUF8129 domain-containing protein n=1 Tax=Nocardioides deserti TaxID=1588644 RepID=A0ABR6U6W9_9ACTN|nr:hypothetical protein [Nocardioides deserti]MBC2960180.1 hypothetical protein [Nocardioides deserti]GGO74688.1 hypothetical protein GCM10012276_23240 [Nocardioides deserti]